MYYQFFDCPTLSVLLLQENQMNTTAQTMNEINDLISLIQQNKKTLSDPNYFRCEREILSIKDHFYTIVDNLNSEFTEQQLYTIENDLLFYYQTLKEIIDIINYKFQTHKPPLFLDSIQQSPPFPGASRYEPLIPHPPISCYYVESCIIQQKDIEQYTADIQRRIAGIIKEIKENQKTKLRHIAEIYQLYNGLAANLTQEMLALDQQLYDRQTQQYEAMIKKYYE